MTRETFPNISCRAGCDAPARDDECGKAVECRLCPLPLGQGATSWTSRIDDLPVDVDAWIETYNCERTHSGKYCYGKTPMQTFLDSASLAYDEQLDRIHQTGESESMTA
jgi:hypothetical protein